MVKKLLYRGFLKRKYNQYKKQYINEFRGCYDNSNSNSHIIVMGDSLKVFRKHYTNLQKQVYDRDTYKNAKQKLDSLYKDLKRINYIDNVHTPGGIHTPIVHVVSDQSDFGVTHRKTFPITIYGKPTLVGWIRNTKEPRIRYCCTNEIVPVKNLHPKKIKKSLSLDIEEEALKIIEYHSNKKDMKVKNKNGSYNKEYINSFLLGLVRLRLESFKNGYIRSNKLLMSHKTLLKISKNINFYNCDIFNSFDISINYNIPDDVLYLVPQTPEIVNPIKLVVKDFLYEENGIRKPIYGFCTSKNITDVVHRIKLN